MIFEGARKKLANRAHDDNGGCVNVRGCEQ